MARHSKTIIAIPVKNEEATIAHCLQTLKRQENHFDLICLLLNNCTDRTLNICKLFASRFSKLEILQCQLHDPLASAGEARRLVLNHAMERAGEGTILTTDADAVVDADWVAANLRALECGAELVCGMAVLDASEAASLPHALLEDERNEANLLAIQDEIASMTNPDPADPWPRHQQRSGASLAMRANVLRKAGGAPAVPTGEDRALIERLREVDAKIRHAPEIIVRVSGRLEGRAEGGMAATLKRRAQKRDPLTDERLEPTVDAYRRALAQARLGAVIAGLEDTERFAKDLLIAPYTLRDILLLPYYGAAWGATQRASPVLRRRRVAFVTLHQEIRQAAALLDQLQAEKITRGDRTPQDNAGNLFDDENAG